MALDPEELQLRRQERQAQRQARQQQRRSLRIRLLWAGIAVVLCGLVIFLVVKNTGSSQPNTGSTAGAGAKTVIHLAAVGDLNVTEKVVASGGPSYDYTAALMDVAPLLANADVSVLNLEGNFYGAPYGVDRSAPQSLADALSRAGVDLVQLANSYSIYKGTAGLSSTINAVRLAGMEPLGVYASTKEAKAGKGYTIRNVQGIRIAFVAFTKGMDGMALPPGSEGCVNVLYQDYSTDYQKVDTEAITKVLDAVARERPDLTVALLHWGSEFNDNLSKTQTTICKLMQEKGVDAIIGTHSHYVQKMEYNAQNGTFVAYSLGDFFSDAARAGSEYSVVLDLEITKDNRSGQTKITGYSYTPIFSVVEPGKASRVMRIAETMQAYREGYIERVSDQVYHDMEYALKRIEARVKGQ